MRLLKPLIITSGQLAALPRAEWEHQRELGVTMLQRFLSDDDGATAIEYGLIAGIVGIGIIVSLTLVRGELLSVFTDIVTNFQNI